MLVFDKIATSLLKSALIHAADKNAWAKIWAKKIRGRHSMTEVTDPKFAKGQKIKPIGVDDKFAHEVLATPENCTHPRDPSYMLATPASGDALCKPFFRTQAHVERNWELVTDVESASILPVMDTSPMPLFPLGSHIRHKKSAFIYEVLVCPDVGRLEATDTPAYAYKSLVDGRVWFRCQAEMEDGRFELYLAPSSAAV